jgi:phage-related protein
MVGVNDFASNIIPAITTVFQTLPVALATMISNMAPILIEQVPVLVKGFADGLIIGVPTLIKAAITLIQGLSGGIRESIPAFINEAMPLLLNFSQELLNNMSLLVEAGIELVIGLVQGLMDGLPTLIEFVPQIISNIANIINQNMPKILEAGIRILLELIKGLTKAIPSLIANAGNIVKAIWDVFLAFKWVDLGKNIINGIKKGIEGFKDRLIESFKNIAKNAFNAVKNFFGIKSPSKLMEKEIGRFIPEGIAVGITANTKSVTRAMDDISNMTLGSAENMIGRSRISSDFGSGNMSTNNYGGFNFNIYARDNQSAKEIAEEVQSLIMNEINAGRKVFA